MIGQVFIYIYLSSMKLDEKAWKLQNSLSHMVWKQDHEEDTQERIQSKTEFEVSVKQVNCCEKNCCISDQST